MSEILNDIERERLKRLLAEECTYQLDDDVMDEFLSRMKLVKLNKGDYVFDEGEYNPSVYILKEGILARTHLVDGTEHCISFALPATLFVATASYYMGKRSFYREQACCYSEVLYCTREDYDNLIKTSHRFAQWVYSLAMCQVYYYEMKSALIKGAAIDRFKSLAVNRPEILRNVSNKMVAAYLGISPQYLCQLKKKLYNM